MSTATRIIANSNCGQLLHQRNHTRTRCSPFISSGPSILASAECFCLLPCGAVTAVRTYTPRLMSSNTSNISATRAV